MSGLWIFLQRIVFEAENFQTFHSEDGIDGLQSMQFIGFQIEHSEVLDFMDGKLFVKFGDVIVGEVELDEVKAFGEKVKLRILELIARKYEDFKFLGRDDSLIERTVGGVLELL
jgi:hypothetical protein